MGDDEGVPTHCELNILFNYRSAAFFFLSSGSWKLLINLELMRVNYHLAAISRELF
jgi:hypothetical protein